MPRYLRGSSLPSPTRMGLSRIKPDPELSREELVGENDLEAVPEARAPAGLASPIPRSPLHREHPSRLAMRQLTVRRRPFRIV